MLDFVRDGGCHPATAHCDGKPRKIAFDDWAAEPVAYRGSAMPPGISEEQAASAAESAHDAYESWVTSGAPAVPFFIPPRRASIGPAPAAWDGVTWANDHYRTAGYQPPWIDRSSPHTAGRS